MNEKSRVSVVRCWDYGEQNVDEAVRKAVDLLGGLNGRVQSGRRVLLKPNCLDATKPDKGVTTHPLVFKSAAKLFMDHGCECFFGDGPAVDSPVKALKTAGFYEAAAGIGVSASDFYTPVEIANPKGKLIKRFTLAKAYKDVDYVVSLPKLKTHGQTYFTGAVKNMFGLIPGLRKAEYHFKLTDTEQFSQMLVDLYALTRPVLSVMDGIIGMDGNGPKSGRLRDVGLIIAGFDAVAVDSIACLVIGLNPMKVPFIRLAHEQGVGAGEPSDIEVVGEELNKVKIKYFEIMKPSPDVRFLGKFLSQKVKGFMTRKPIVDPKICNGCYTCIDICPSIPKALSVKDREKEKVPKIDYKICVRCYCCQEVCPRGAIKLVRNPFAKFLLYLIDKILR